MGYLQKLMTLILIELSPIFKFKLNASSAPINILFELKILEFPFDLYLSKKFNYFFFFINTF